MCYQMNKNFLKHRKNTLIPWVLYILGKQIGNK